MRINCPSCQIEYDVPETKLRGRTLRCAGCGHSWMPLPVDPAPPPESELSPAPDALPDVLADSGPDLPQMRMRPVLPAPRRGLDWVLLGWIATILLVGGLGLGVIHYRSNIMHAWPPSIRLYRALAIAGESATPNLGR
jgi:predicted Zn finger-like uncharacterized protein